MRAVPWRPALALVFVGIPAPSLAQDCSARVSPGELDAGTKAVPVRVIVSEPIGAVTGVDASHSSGISLAFHADLPPTELGALGGPARTIKMGESENIWVVWLSVADDGEGTHRVTFTAREGQCGARLVVKPQN